MTATDPILIFCDGACSGNPGPGGWASVVVTPEKLVHELGARDPKTTNNKMELTAVIEALKIIADVETQVVLYTDSTYVIRGITQWIWGWIRNGWKTAEGAEVSNKELWQELSSVVSKRKKAFGVTWKYVRGHTGVPGNERCDEIAVAFSKGVQPHLFFGPLSEYSVAIYNLPVDQPLPDMRSKSGEKAKAHSYLSLLGGTPMRHSNWADCERRVKGQPGAKFKKAASPSDETAILKSWGVDPSKLKS